MTGDAERARRWRRGLAGTMGLPAAFAVACSTTSPPPASAPHALDDRAARAATAAAHAAEALRAPAKSHLVATIARKATGPMVARSVDGASAIAAWIVPAERGPGQSLIAVMLAADGAPLGEARVLTPVPQEATSLVVVPAGGPGSGWLIAWSALLDRGESLTVMGVGADGVARGSPADVARTSDHIVWADIVATGHGATCVWAEETPAGDVNMLTSAVTSSGSPRGMPVRVVKGIGRWQAVRAGDGVGLALVAVGTSDSKNPAGALTWMRLDADGRPTGATAVIAPKPTVSSDVDVVPFGDGWLFAWTDRTGEDEEVMLATIDASGAVTGPSPALKAVGGSSLVDLAAGPQGVALAWEQSRGRAPTSTPLHLALVTPVVAIAAPQAPALTAPQGQPLAAPSEAAQASAQAAPRGDGATPPRELVAQSVTSVEVAGVAATAHPELEATDDGFALIAPLRTCSNDNLAGSCDDASPPTFAPTFVRFGARLDPLQAEPLFAGDHRAAVAWGLRCVHGQCLALSASADVPTPVFAVDLVPRTSPFVAPMIPPPPSDVPSVVGVTTIASGRPYADVGAARVGPNTLVTALTSAVDAPSDRRRRPTEGGLVTVRAVDDEGRPIAAVTTLSSQAASVGGVSIAPGRRAEDGAAVAWIARDDGETQVHVAHVDARGRRTNEVKLTTANGGASDVAIARAGDGWVVAWVDARDGNGEVYATRIDADLQRTAREERITNAPGDADDVAIAVHGDTVWLAWSDPRESPAEGVADVYVTTLRARDCKRASDEVRVVATATHSRSPTIMASGDGALVAWIEQAPTGLDAPGATMLARLDAAGHVAGTPSVLALAAPGRPTAVALAPPTSSNGAPDRARVVVARATGGAIVLDAFVLDHDGSAVTKPWPVLVLDAPGTFDAALSIASDAVFFDDVGASPGDHRVRRASISWRR